MRPQVLSNYIARRGPLNDKNVLELGSGTGLVGLVAAKLGAHVIVTDQAFVAYLLSPSYSLFSTSDRIQMMSRLFIQPPSSDDVS